MRNLKVIKNLIPDNSLELALSFPDGHHFQPEPLANCTQETPISLDRDARRRMFQWPVLERRS